MSYAYRQAAGGGPVGSGTGIVSPRSVGASLSAGSAAREGDLSRSRRDLERLRPERERRVAMAL